jgi:hypothetical protein
MGGIIPITVTNCVFFLTENQIPDAAARTGVSPREFSGSVGICGFAVNHPRMEPRMLEFGAIVVRLFVEDLIRGRFGRERRPNHKKHQNQGILWQTISGRVIK